MLTIIGSGVAAMFFEAPAAGLQHRVGAAPGGGPRTEDARFLAARRIP